MTTTTDDERSVHLTRRLSVLPAAVGVLGLVWALAGAWAAGLTDGSNGGVLAIAVATLVGATVVSGAGSGLYAGLALLTIAALAGGDGDLERRELIALGLALVVVHETVRFSLDARRPARLGPGLIGGFLARTTGVAALAAVVMLALHRLASTSIESPVWIPIGLAAAGLPVLALSASSRFRSGTGIDAGRGLPARIYPAVLAALATVVVLTLAVLGATARSTFDGSDGPTTRGVPVTTTTTVTTPDDIVDDGQSAEFRRGLTLLFLIGATLILGALYLALRRPEAVFDLDDLDYDDEDHSFGFAPPGRADTDSTVAVDEGELARLLADLRLDIETEADPGRAVRFAYANVERRLADLDLPREPEETEREFLERALAQVESGQALIELTGLFERARFGTDRADERMRSEALEAITELERTLVPPADETTDALVDEPTGEPNQASTNQGDDR